MNWSYFFGIAGILATILCTLWTIILVQPPGTSRRYFHKFLLRRSYPKRVIKQINRAQKEVLLMNSQLNPSSSGEKYIIQINKSIRAATRRGVSVRILLSKSFNRIPGALELAQKCGAEIRFDQTINPTGINYNCFDSQFTIIAFREGTEKPDEYQRSFSWSEVYDHFSTKLFVDNFNFRWKSIGTNTLKEYLRAVLSASQSINTLGQTCIELGITSQEAKHLTDQKSFILFIIGRPGSGKSTLAKALVHSLISTGRFESAVHLSDLNYLTKLFSNVGLSLAIESTSDGGFFIKDSSVYDDALVDLASQASLAMRQHSVTIIEFSRQSYNSALSLLKLNGISPHLIIYLNVDLLTAMKRNKLRSISQTEDTHYVSEREMKKTFSHDDVAELMLDKTIRLVTIENNDHSTSLADKVIEQVTESLRIFVDGV